MCWSLQQLKHCNMAYQKTVTGRYCACARASQGTVVLFFEIVTVKELAAVDMDCRLNYGKYFTLYFTLFINYNHTFGYILRHSSCGKSVSIQTLASHCGGPSSVPMPSALCSWWIRTFVTFQHWVSDFSVRHAVASTVSHYSGYQCMDIPEMG